MLQLSLNLSLTGKRWIVRHDMRGMLPRERRSATALLQQALLEDRDLSIPSDRQKTIGSNALLFPDIHKAIDRIKEAIRKKETIAIFGDYDCDGVTSTALLARYFYRRGIRPLLRLPHREHEGYGLKPKIVEELHKAGATLLLTADTGISARREIQMASDAGIDTIILDHHHVPALLPPATAILHPAIAPLFPLPHPAAAGVTWSVVSALEAADGHADWPGREEDIALGAIGTIADLVELRGDNRALVMRGIAALNSIKEGPLALLKLQSGILGNISCRDIAFRIAPRLNAAGRMAEPDIALHALLGDHASLIRLEELNTERQSLVASLYKDHTASLLQSEDAFLCLRGSQFPAGICGLIAGKLTEATGKPSLIAHDQGTLCMASVRSISAYNVTEGLGRASELLLSHGGHAMAAGCTFESHHFDELRNHLIADVRERVPAEELTPSARADVSIEAEHLSLELSEALQCLEPHGQGNPEPTFLLHSVLLQSPRTVGRDNAHLQATLQDKKIIGFHLGKFHDHLQKPVDILCRLGIDTWQGVKKAQLMVDDMRVSDEGKG